MRDKESGNATLRGSTGGGNVTGAEGIERNGCELREKEQGTESRRTLGEGSSGQYPLVQNMTVTEGGTANMTCRVEYNDNTSLQCSKRMYTAGDPER
ncbi:Cell adhesion molecule 2 [Liparis tanakae]|uniref:Cell adhesion molecule 2 n=1 Tax=Liparis tanakae TaxID=230148 RepID=A0A4Z2F3F3_9TELE|nr:Cell adhesion molecule 2 [Liparis tanakae]